jgi:hypothetical protein
MFPPGAPVRDNDDDFSFFRKKKEKWGKCIKNPFFFVVRGFFGEKGQIGKVYENPIFLEGGGKGFLGKKDK